MKLTRRTILSMTAAATAMGFAGAAPVMAADGDTYNVDDLMKPEGWTDHILGDENAPVTLIEYASPTCPHCAAFSNDIYPTFKEQYVDTGKVKFVLRPFLRNVLDAVIFMLADAAGDTSYHHVIETYFKTQNDWGLSNKPRDAIFDIAKQLGFTEESFDKALTNQDLFTGMESLREQALKQFDVTGTPTFYINGKQYSGEQTIEELSAAIDPLAG